MKLISPFPGNDPGREMEWIVAWGGVCVVSAFVGLLKRDPLTRVFNMTPQALAYFRVVEKYP